MNVNFDEDEKNYRACPHCTIQIPSEESSCPHCELPTDPTPRKKETTADERILDKQGRGKKRSRFVIFLILASSVLILSYGGSGLYNKLFGVKIVIGENPGLSIKEVETSLVSNKRVLTGTVINNLKDVPVISLQSIRVKVEVVMKDGKVATRNLFPVGPLSEPGALLVGDSGTFEVDLPRTNVKEVRLDAQLIDLAGR